MHAPSFPRVLRFIRLRLTGLLMLGAAVSQGADPVVLKVGEGEPLPRTLYAFNSNLLTATAFQGISYGGPEIAQAMTDLRPSGLRFPGGTTANNYLWQEDSFSLQADDKTQWAAQQLALFRKIGRAYDLPGYARLCREQGLTPIWVLNVYEETPESVVALFEKLDELGLDLRHVEMGNEPYWDPRSLMNVWKYMEFCRPLAAAIRQHRPEVKIGACFGPVREDQAYAKKWNAPLAEQDWYDAAVYHEYYGGQGFAMEAGVELPAGALSRPEGFIDEAVEHLSEILPGKPVWFTEWNIGQKGLNQWKNTGAELLFLGAAMTRVLHHRDRFEWSCFHQLYEGKFGTLVHDRESGRQTMPSYEFFRLMGAVWDGAAEYLPLAAGDSDEVIGFGARGRDGERGLLVNRGEEAVPLALPASWSGELRAVTLDVTPTEMLPMSEGLTRPLEMAKGVVVLPPTSITVIGSAEVVRRCVRRERKISGNLLPVRPHLSLWHPPYARKQPRVAPDGSYTLDLTQLADKGSAVVTMDLSGFAPEPGVMYQVSFEARAVPAVGCVSKLPQAAAAGSADPAGGWMQVLPKFETQRLEFVYDPEVNGGNVSFFFSGETLAKGGSWIMRDFSVQRVTSPPADDSSR